MYTQTFYIKSEILFIFLRNLCASALLTIAVECSNLWPYDFKKASLALLYLPLWCILSGTAPVPFEIPLEIEKVKHNDDNSVWWGISDKTILVLIEKMKKLFIGHDEYAYKLFIILSHYFSLA